MEWSDYQLILAIVREKTVRGTARHLGISHATVSRRLTQLNSGSGGPLVQKSPSGLWPTKAGQTIVEAAEKIEAITDEATRRRRATQQKLSGSLLISIPVMVMRHLLLDEIAKFTELYPNIDLTVDGSDNFVDLDRAEADLVIRTSKSPPNHWVGRRLFPYGVSLYAHKNYLASHSIEELKWIAPPNNIERWQNWLTDSPYPDASISLTITDIAGRFMAIKRGLGMGRAACFMADPDPDLIRLPGAPIVEAEPFWILCHPDFAKTTRAKAALKFFATGMESQKTLIQGKT